MGSSGRPSSRIGRLAGAFWRAHLQNAITYEMVPVERGAIQAKVTATGNLNAVVDVLVSSQLGKLSIAIPSKLYVLSRKPYLCSTRDSNSGTALRALARAFAIGQFEQWNDSRV